MLKSSIFKNRPSIAMLHYTCPPVVGGVEAVMAAHARLFAAYGYPVTLLTGRGPVPSTSRPGIETRLEPLLDSKGERLNALNRELEKGIIPSDFAAFTDELLERLLVLLEGHTACIVHNALTLHKNLPLTAALARASSQTTVKIIAWCHDLAWTNPLYLPALYDKYPWNLLKQAVPGITYVAISPQRQKEILETFEPTLSSCDVQIVPNGVSQELFLGLKPATCEVLKTAGLLQARKEGALLLLLPARITRRKNIELAIKTLAALKNRGINARLIVTGPPGPHNVRIDEYVQELLALRKRLGVVEETVFLMERWLETDGAPRVVEDEVIADLYRYCDALIFPSSQEGFGIPILEAGLSRLPVFCADIPPFIELAGKHGVYFAPDADPETVATLILQKLVNDSAYQLRQEVLSKYTWETVFERSILPLLANA